MMAARFRSVTWVAIALVPALGCYLVTQRVAAERAELAKVERKIGQTRRDIRDLETELGTRGSMAQIERWNGQTFALAAPTAQQFIEGDVQLASLTALPALPRPVAPAAPAVVAAPADVRQASFSPAPTAPKPAAADVREVAFRPAARRPEPAAEVRQVAFRPAARRAEPAAEAPQEQPLLRQANYIKPSREQVRPVPAKVAMLSGGNGPLDARTLADIGRIANAERGSRRP